MISTDDEIGSGDEQPRRFFTVDEANQRLPLVRVIVADIVTLFTDVQDRRQRLADLLQRDANRGQRTQSVYTEELEQMQADIDTDIERLNGFARELAELGAELKDPTIGLIDFPARVDDREVCLCWQQGESDIAFWHETDTGFAGRRPVDDLPAKVKHKQKEASILAP